ncbi:hypothetical protein ANO11243_041750 [Dothideomycetidae sp. 11243]|nr:hypothetical protein ANO11243_041750 [fungal sp. No.11243]
MSSGFDMNSHFTGVDPSQLGQTGNNATSFGQGSFNLGNSGIADDELADLAGSLDNAQLRNNGLNQRAFFGNNSTSGSMPMPMGQQNMNVYSSTPEGAPIQSPFVNHDGFNYGQFRTPGSQQARSMNMGQSAGFANSMMRAQHLHSMERKISESRSPASPHTPGLSGLHLGEPEFPSAGMQQQHMMNRVSSSVPTTWDGTPNGPSSWNDSSPYPSPSSIGHQMHHAQISEVLRTDSENKTGQVPVKPEPGLAPNLSYHSVEAKRRRRRESHNLVERRRRDNINERIQDLANLVPQHRLEDEKVRKHLQTNSPLSPSITATSMSPPQSASLLSTSGGRRPGAITQGLPMDDKDKGPNKGDILNSSVSWTRDVLWFLKLKMEQEAQLEELCSSNGIDWPFSRSDDEKRMRSEIQEVVERNMRNHNVLPYTRGTGSGLRVPGFTNIAGETLPNSEGENSPAMAGGMVNNNWATFQDHPVFKEDDEFDDDMMS